MSCNGADDDDDDNRDLDGGGGRGGGATGFKHFMNSRCHWPEAAPQVMFQICMLGIQTLVWKFFYKQFKTHVRLTMPPSRSR